MNIQEHCNTASLLIPKSAELALKLLASEIRVPTDWVVHITPVLAARSLDADVFKQTDLGGLVGESPSLYQRMSRRFRGFDQDAAQRFVDRLITDSALETRRRGGAG